MHFPALRTFLLAYKSLRESGPPKCGQLLLGSSSNSRYCTWPQEARDGQFLGNQPLLGVRLAGRVYTIVCCSVAYLLREKYLTVCSNPWAPPRVLSDSSCACTISNAPTQGVDDLAAIMGKASLVARGHVSSRPYRCCPLLITRTR